MIRTEKNRDAFTLTELAIVLGVMGILLGGIWEMISSGRENARRQNVANEIDLIVNNVRAYYGGQVGVPDSNVTSTVPALINANAIPTYMQRADPTTCAGGAAAPCTDNPWGPASNGALDPSGTFRVCSWSTTVAMTDCPNPPAGLTGTTQYFGIALTGLSQGACAALVSLISGPLGPAGLIGVVINPAVNALVTGAPVSVAVSLPQCAPGGANTTSEVIFVYKLVQAPS